MLCHIDILMNNKEGLEKFSYAVGGEKYKFGFVCLFLEKNKGINSLPAILRRESKRVM